MVYVYVLSFVSIGLFCRRLAAKNPIFAVFALRHLLVSTFGGNLRKFSMVHKNKLYPIQQHHNSFCTPTPSGRNRAHNCDVQKRDEQTNKQNTQRFWPRRRRVKFEPHQTWRANRGPRARSCTSKTFGGLTHSFAARGR